MQNRCNVVFWIGDYYSRVYSKLIMTTSVQSFIFLLKIEAMDLDANPIVTCCTQNLMIVFWAGLSYS